MQKITDLFEMPLEEINYRLEGLLPLQLEMLSHVVSGKTDEEISNVLNINVPLIRNRLQSACDRVGVGRRYELIALYAIYEYSRLHKDPAVVSG